MAGGSVSGFIATLSLRPRGACLTSWAPRAVPCGASPELRRGAHWTPAPLPPAAPGHHHPALCFRESVFGSLCKWGRVVLVLPPRAHFPERRGLCARPRSCKGQDFLLFYKTVVSCPARASHTSVPTRPSPGGWVASVSRPLRIALQRTWGCGQFLETPTSVF